MMMKWLILILTFSALSTACGKRSTIKNSVKAEKLACAYGDCEHIVQNVTFPLDDATLAYTSPLPGLGPIAGGIVKFVGDIFAKNTDMGKVELSYTQSLPNIPEAVKSVRLKRFFFYMKPVDKKNRNVRKIFTDWFNRYLLGKGHTTFKFLDKMAVRLSTTKIEDRNYASILRTTIDDETIEDQLNNVFKKYQSARVVDPEIATDIILLKYHKKTRFNDTNHKLYGKIHYLETTGDSKILRNYFLHSKDLAGHYQRVLLFDNAIILELKKDPYSSEVFNDFMMKNAEDIQTKLKVNFIDTCKVTSCLEIKVSDINLIPIARKGNALKLDAIVEADTVPESFMLKGFVEFELKVKSEI